MPHKMFKDHICAEIVKRMTFPVIGIGSTSDLDRGKKKFKDKVFCLFVFDFFLDLFPIGNALKPDWRGGI